MDHDQMSSISKGPWLLVLAMMLTGCASNITPRTDCERRQTFYLKVVIENGAPTKVVDADGTDARELTVCPRDKVQWRANQKFWIWFYDNNSPSDRTMFESGWRNRIGAPIRPDAPTGDYGYGVATNCQTGRCKELDPMIIVRD